MPAFLMQTFSLPPENSAAGPDRQACEKAEPLVKKAARAPRRQSGLAYPKPDSED